MKFSQCLLSNTEIIVKRAKDLNLKQEMLKLLGKKKAYRALPKIEVQERSF